MYETQLQETATLQKRVVEDFERLGIVEGRRSLDDLEIRQSDPNLYNDFAKLKAINIEIKRKQDLVVPWERLKARLEELELLLQMSEEAKDASQKGEADRGLAEIAVELEKLELRRFFQSESDPLNTYLTINSGAGGTESCDWAMMLWRMYMRWADLKGFKTEVLDYQEGEGAGIKSATVFVEGSFAHGWLQCEVGVHRLVRISPYDAAKRRHTSFAAVYATADLDDDIEVTINVSDLRVDTYRSSGAGGQHVNKTDSAVRLTHLPTGIVVACQNERSQIQNREKAMKLLKAKLYEKAKADREAELASKAVEKKKIEWGSQIRSYVLHPYNLVKDHRTEHETSNTGAVLDGEIDGFMMAYLRAGETNVPKPE